MKLNKGLWVSLGEWEAAIYGGPYKNYDPKTRRLVGVKMAAEITHIHHVSIPTRDFSTPDVGTLERGLVEVFKYIRLGNDIYAGCMGGIGRTGLFMGCLLKCVNAYKNNDEEDSDIDFIVQTVRRALHPDAIETAEQIRFIRDFDVTHVVDEMHVIFDKPVAEKVVEREVMKVVVEKVITPWEWVMRYFGLNI